MMTTTTITAAMALLLLVVAGLQCSCVAGAASTLDSNDNGNHNNLSNINTNSNTNNDESSPCTLYMAPTSTSTSTSKSTENMNIKLSMYAGVNIYNGTVIGRPEIVIPIIDPERHYYSPIARQKRAMTKRKNLNRKNQDKQNKKPQFFQELKNFMWTPPTTASQYEIDSSSSSSSSSVAEDEDAIDMVVSIPGVGALGNQHPTLVSNADWDHDAYAEGNVNHSDNDNDNNNADLPLDNSRSKNVAYPGRGAHSLYNQMYLVAKADIPAGMEILVNINNDNEGDDNDDDDDDDEDKDLPHLSSSDFRNADQSLDKIHSFFQKHREDIVKIYGKKKINELYSYMINDVIRRSDPSYQLFPKTVEDLQSAVEMGSFRTKYPEITKDLQWLKDNGQCLDGIYSKRLTGGNENVDVDDVGADVGVDVERGAFATRFVKSGDFIAPVPLMLIPDKSFLDMYDLSGLQQQPRKSSSSHGMNDVVSSSQLILNYSFGHKDSSLLFYPYGMNINFINHRPTSTSAIDAGATATTSDGNSEQKYRGKIANAKLEWTDAKYHRPELLALSPDKLMASEGAFYGLGMDIVATRDIQPDEEIFIDYGPLWQQKWEEHVQNWNHEMVWDTKASDLNSAMMNSSSDGGRNYFYTQDEIESLKQANTYDIPDSIMTVAYLEWEDEGQTDKLSSEKKNSGTWYQFDKTTAREGYALKPCVVVDRYRPSSSDGETTTRSDNYEYTVEIYDTVNDMVEFVKNVPQKYIRYLDKPYTSDIHSKDAFRHYIEIPDEIFPEAWRDLKS